MNIVKRQLNVGTGIALIALILALYGWARGYSVYRGELSAQQIACEKQLDFDRKIAQREAMPSDQREPMFIPDVSYQYLCERKVEQNIFIYGKNDFGISVMLFLMIAVLNYILLGKVTLWNRVSGSERQEKPK